jgi:hypothetical protein
MGIDEESSHPRVCSGVADGVIWNIPKTTVGTDGTFCPVNRCLKFLVDPKYAKLH